MKISVSSYSFSQLISAGKITQSDTPEEAYRLGFDSIEFTDMQKDTFDEQAEYAAEIREKCDALGMDISAYTVYANLYQPKTINNEIERIKKQLDIAKILKAPVLRHDACWSLDGRSFGLMLPDIAAAAREICGYAQSLGIKTCVENHGFIAQDSYRMEQLFNSVNHENFGLLIDMGNFVCVDENSAEAVSRLAPYAVHVHAKDMYLFDGNAPHGNFTRGGNKFEGAVIGEGIIPIEQDIRILKSAGYDGTVSIEYEGGKDCIEGISRGFENLKAILKNTENEK